MLFRFRLLRYWISCLCTGVFNCLKNNSHYDNVFLSFRSGILLFSLIPGSYNPISFCRFFGLVVVPSLTPGSYKIDPAVSLVVRGLQRNLREKKWNFSVKIELFFFIFFKKCLKMAVACQ